VLLLLCGVCVVCRARVLRSQNNSGNSAPIESGALQQLRGEYFMLIHIRRCYANRCCTVLYRNTLIYI
jgi:hypothetical protein